MTGLLVLSVWDLRTRCIPAGIALALSAALVLTSFLSGTLQLPAAFSGLLPAFLSFVFTIPDRDSFGLGDVWVLALIGFTEGLESTICILILAAVMAAVYGLIHSGNYFRKQSIPFVPFLCAATGCVVLCRAFVFTA
ncbi:MAG: prepilin peptidase [Lachnospiraceae bacterium]|jgi:prepilin signal peptidase PulO-like enzyme (type II secretory pathway)